MDFFWITILGENPPRVCGSESGAVTASACVRVCARVCAFVYVCVHAQAYVFLVTD